MQKRTTVILILLVSAVLLLTSGCTQTENATATHVQVEIVYGAETLLSTQTEVAKSEPKADDAVIAACKQEKLPYSYSSGMFDNFGGKASTQTDGWLLYHNGKLADVGAKDISISENDTITFKYENYDSAFTK